VQKLGMIIEDVEKKRLIRRDVLVKRQGQMIATSGLLISQLFNILQDIETEELARAEQNTVEATEVVNTGITRMNTLLILFILGAAILALLIFTDISRSNKYRRQLLAAKEEAEYTGQVKQRFLANMSHELRTPLQAIAGIAEQMKLNAQAKPKEIDIVYHSSQHLLQIVNEVLDYSKIVSGSFQIDQHPFDIHAVMAEVCAIMEVRAEQKGLSFRYNPGFSGSGAFVGDSFRLKQILFNLIGNAIKFTNEGSITFTVVQEDFKAQSLFRFIVKDTGIGMSDEEMQRMFTQFEQGATIPDYQHNGTGLGLSIVRELVDIQQGTIQSESSPGKGTVFTVELSYQRARQAPAQISERSSLTHQTFKGVVWIVDDDAYILELCRSILNKQGIKHRCFSTPGAVLRALPDAQVSLVFLDIRMPEMSGFDLHRRMKEKLPARYIALTAQALPEERSEILEKGFDGLLMKPFLEHDLLQQIYATEAVQSTEETSLRFDKLQSMAGDDQKVMQNLLQSFADTTEADLVQLQSSIERKAAAEAADLLHRLAGRSGQFGYKELMLHFRKAELLLRKVPDLDDPLSQELEALIIETRALLRRDDSPLRKK